MKPRATSELLNDDLFTGGITVLQSLCLDQACSRAKGWPEIRHLCWSAPNVAHVARKRVRARMTCYCITRCPRIEVDNAVPQTLPLEGAICSQTRAVVNQFAWSFRTCCSTSRAIKVETFLGAVGQGRSHHVLQASRTQKLLPESFCGNFQLRPARWQCRNCLRHGRWAAESQYFSIP